MAKGRLSQHCYVVWRKPSRVGVMFDRFNEPSIDLVPIGIDGRHDGGDSG